MSTKPFFFLLRFEPIISEDRKEKKRELSAEFNSWTETTPFMLFV